MITLRRSFVFFVATRAPRDESPVGVGDDGGGLGDEPRRGAFHRRVDVAQLDAPPVNLHLRVEAPDERRGDEPVRVRDAPRDVARAEPPNDARRRRRRSIGRSVRLTLLEEKTLRRVLGSGRVPQAHLVAAEPHLDEVRRPGRGVGRRDGRPEPSHEPFIARAARGRTATFFERRVLALARIAAAASRAARRLERIVVEGAETHLARATHGRSERALRRDARDAREGLVPAALGDAVRVRQRHRRRRAFSAAEPRRRERRVERLAARGDDAERRRGVRSSVRRLRPDVVRSHEQLVPLAFADRSERRRRRARVRRAGAQEARAELGVREAPRRERGDRARGEGGERVAEARVERVRGRDEDDVARANAMRPNLRRAVRRQRAAVDQTPLRRAGAPGGEKHRRERGGAVDRRDRRIGERCGGGRRGGGGGQRGGGGGERIGAFVLLLRVGEQIGRVDDDEGAEAFAFSACFSACSFSASSFSASSASSALDRLPEALGRLCVRRVRAHVRDERDNTGARGRGRESVDRVRGDERGVRRAGERDGERRAGEREALRLDERADDPRARRVRLKRRESRRRERRVGGGGGPGCVAAWVHRRAVVRARRR